MDLGVRRLKCKSIYNEGGGVQSGALITVLLSYKGSDMTSFLRILSLMTDGMRKHLTTMTTDED